MIDAEAVLAAADRVVEAKDRFAAGPSADLPIAAAVHALVAHMNAELGKIAAGCIAVLEMAPGVVSGEIEPAAYNFAVAELAKQLGVAT